MTDNLTNQKLGDVSGNITVKQDRLTLSDDDTDGSLYAAQKWRNQPLDSNETHATIKLSTENGTAQIALDGQQLDALIDTLHHIQEAYND